MLFSYFERYGLNSKGGSVWPIDRRRARTLIKKYNGKIRKEEYRYRAQRHIDLSNGNHIFIFV
jgi:hypothetical protein